MRTTLIITLAVQVILLIALGVVLGEGRVPLGVRGEWEWSRLQVRPAVADFLFALGGVATYAGFVAVGWRSLVRPGGRWREGFWLAGLGGAAIAVQALVPAGAPDGYGLSKWAIALHNPGSSGYFTVAKNEIRDPWQFLRDYPAWLQSQTVPRRGAHPPGLFLITYGLLHAMESRPNLAQFVLDVMPGSVQGGFAAIALFEPVLRAERAALALMAALTWLVCALTVVPLYLLARSVLSASGAWSAAALWPLVPSVILFQPVADTAFPFLATAAMALSSWAVCERPGLSLCAGLVLALGMMLTLAFLPVGLTVGLVLAWAPGLTWRRRILLISATGLGFLIPTLAAWVAFGANPFLIWWLNWSNHGRFYLAFTRSYPRWVIVNLVEVIVALGIPAASWAVLSLSIRQTPRLVWSTFLVLALLNFGGLTLSEVARLWLPWMPLLLIASSSGLARLGAGPGTLAATVTLMGLETLMLQSTIQVVYPV